MQTVSLAGCEIVQLSPEICISISNGEQAEMVCRFRHNNDGSSYPTEYGDNDYGRMRTQRDFIKTTMKQLLNVNNLTKINALLDIIFGSITTNIDEQTIKDYVPFLVEFDSENIKSARSDSV